MTDLETNPPAVTGRRPRDASRTSARPTSRQSSRTSEQARARRASARRVRPAEPRDAELGENAPPEVAPPESDHWAQRPSQSTTELPAYRESGKQFGEVEAQETAGLVRAADPSRDPEPAVVVALPVEVEPSRARRLQGSLARLDARTAARPFPETAIGTNYFDIAPIEVAPKQPLLVRLLRLQHVRPTGWQRAAVGDLPILIAVLLVLADLATAWTLLVLPAVVLALVKFHDIIESRLAPLPSARPAQRPFGDLGPAA